MTNKNILSSIFLILTFTLLVLPLVLVFNDVVTKLVERWEWYTFVQREIVPFQVKIVGLFIKSFGIAFIALPDRMIVNNLELRMSWNCLGWQSLLLFFISAIVGLHKNSFTLISKLQVLVLGLFGIFWVNIARMTAIVLLSIYAQPFYQYIFHDLLAAVVTIGYLLLFWKISFVYVLEQKNES